MAPSETAAPIAASPGDARADHEHLGRRHLAGCRHLAREEAAEVVARLDNRAIPCYVRHGRQGVHLLGPADARHHVHGERRDALGLERIEQLGILRWIKKADDDLPRPGHLHFGGLWRAHLCHHIGLRPEIDGGRHHRHARLRIGAIGEPGPGAGARFHDALVAELLQRGGGLRCQRDALFPQKNLLRRTDPHDVPFRSSEIVGAWVVSCASGVQPH